MKLFKEAAAIKIYIAALKKSGKTIGFVPTMGALHRGHISLAEQAKQKCDVMVCSIFVNPTQFNDATDFEKYPVTIGNDILLLEKAGCDIVFLPSVKEIYPNGTDTPAKYDLGKIENLFEGKYRPGHFQGVCQVVHRLLDIITPDDLFMGLKDYQQCLVIKQLVQLLQLPVQVHALSTYREESGLAMSSRNLRLTNEQRTRAAAIFKMLQYIKDNHTKNTLPDVQNYVKEYLLGNGFTSVDYVSVANADTLQPVSSIDSSQKHVALIAAFIGEVRLIDNMLL